MFSFTLLALMGVLGGYFLDKVSRNSIKMMQENYNTVRYTREMSLALNEVVSILSLRDSTANSRRIELRRACDHFLLYLDLQKIVSKEIGELNLVETLRTDFEQFRDIIETMDRKEGEVPVEVLMRSVDMQNLIRQVYQLNEQAIKRKTDDAFRTGNRVTIVVLVIGFLLFVLAVTSMFYFPDYIADPINRLTLSIQEIARRNYSLRLDVRSDDEFGQLSRAFNEMAEKLEDYENLNISQLLAEKRRIETIISQMREAIIGLDKKNTILFANRTALRLLNLEEDQIVGRSAAAVARENRVMEELVKEVVAGEVGSNRSSSSLALQRRNKTYYFEKDILKVVADRPSSSQQLGGYVIILKNVTELKEQDLAKTNFMATLSHELKTPISAIDMSLGLLRDERIGQLNEDQKDLATTIQQNSERLLKMVNEILDISRIETGQLQIQEEPADPAEIVLKAVEGTKTFFAEKGVRIQQHIADDLPSLLVDVPKTTGVLINFLTNAVRYSPENDFVRIAVVRRNGSIEFSVSDNGPGISREEQARIFKRFRRAKDDKTKGTGLGLSISKEFIEQQGGRIWVKSQVGKGSTFGFSLPVKK